MDAVCEHFKVKEQVLKFYDFDGYRMEFNDWWFNIRPSNTEPYLRFIAEAKSYDKLNSIIEQVKTIINNLA